MVERRPEKIAYLDGLRGMAALNVLLSHFVVAFYPAFYSANMAEAHFAWVDVWSAGSLFSVVYSAFWGVPVLFILSGYVLSFRFFQQRKTAFVTANAYRRYFRLAIPVLVSVLLSWVFLQSGFYYNALAAVPAHSEWFMGQVFQAPVTLWAAMRQGLWECFYPGGNVNMNPVLWTMNYELIGSFIVFSFLAIFGRSSRRWFVYTALLFVFCRSYFWAFVLGMLLSDMRYSDWGGTGRAFLRQHRCFLWGGIGIGIMLLSYFGDGRNAASFILPGDALRAGGLEPGALYHVLGAGFTFLAVLYEPFLQRVLSCRGLVFLGRIAFSMYLTHFLWIASLGCFLFLYFQRAGMGYVEGTFLSTMISVPVIVLSSYVMTRWLEEPAVRWIKQLQKRYFY